MSLRRRLWLVLGGLFLLPIVIGTLVYAFVVPGIEDEQVDAELRAASTVVTSELVDTCHLLGVAGRGVALESALATPGDAVRTAVAGRDATYAVVRGPSGNVVAEAGNRPAGSVAGLPDCIDEDANSPVLAQQIPVTGVPGASSVVLARAVDDRLLTDLSRRSRLDGAIVVLTGTGADTALVATSAEPGPTESIVSAVRSAGTAAAVDGWRTEVARPASGAPYTVVVAAADPVTGSSVSLLAIALLGGCAVVAGLLVLIVARGLSQPFADLTEAAEQISKGNFDTTLSGSTKGEARRLSEAFNRMTVALRADRTALEQSRQELRRSFDRIGDTLETTHDLEGLLGVVLDTAAVTLQARAGVVLWGAPDQITVVAQRGFDEGGGPRAVAPGEGVLGRVIASGEAVRGRLGSGPAELNPSATEPQEGDVLAVALRSMGSVLGVIALYDRNDGRPFDSDSEHALSTLAGQGGVAADNVQLHQEAERLSTTDGLTGLWNFRYLSMSLAREIERATRFERPLAVLMLDLDNFKAVNDEHGHAAGDSVLRELARRVQEQIREVDTFARYGGEEFVVVLPETTIEGASQLAERVCNAVRRKPFNANGEGTLRITVSVGGAAFPNHGASAATLMRAADRALYVAKDAGRDRWHVPDA